MQHIDTRNELIQACLAGDRRSQERLYLDYADAMYNVAFRMTGNSHDAQDILQNSFVDVFRNLSKFKFESTPGSWIKRIVLNKAINFLKQKKIKLTELNDWDLEIIEEENSEVELNIDAIKSAISLLPDGYRIVFSLYLIEGYDHSEIAEILGISVATSKSQYSRARSKLKQLISVKAIYNEK